VEDAEYGSGEEQTRAQSKAALCRSLPLLHRAKQTRTAVSTVYEIGKEFVANELGALHAGADRPCI
jgi:hypothetical protein